MSVKNKTVPSMRVRPILFLLAAVFLLCGFLSAQRTVEYDLYVQDTLVNYTGNVRRALAVNGCLPAPVLYFTEGDTALIRVHNLLDRPTSFHWHGLLVPNVQDGVPYLTTAPVAPGATHIYTFPIRQSGTYWYHSHAGLQEQEGLYGVFVVYKRDDAPHRRMQDSLPEHTVVLSDWTDRSAGQVNRMLHTGSDWFSIEKGSVQSYWEALRKGYFKTKLLNEWKRMQAMDVSDVYYDSFLANGKQELRFPSVAGGGKVRLRLVNGAASTYFWLRYAGGKITVVAADGHDVEPVAVDRMMIAVSETYDVVVDVPADGVAYELQVTSEDRTGGVSVWLGRGKRKSLLPLPRLNYFAGMQLMNKMMKMNGRMESGGMKMELQRMDMNEAMYPELEQGGAVHGMSMPGKKAGRTRDSMPQPALVTLNYAMLRSPVDTRLPAGRQVKDLRFELTGNMERYVWSIDNKTVSEGRPVPIREGENVRIVLYNGTMMRHPMHLHGHFFRVKNGQGNYAPLKFTLDLMPMETDTIEFDASENSRGNWYFHCHVLYHMMSGMGRVFRYEDSPPDPQLPDAPAAWRAFYRPERKYYFSIRNDFATNGNDGGLELGNIRWEFRADWQLGYKDRHGYEAEARFGRYFGRKQWWFPYVGIDARYRKGARHEKNLFGQRYRKDRRVGGVAGVEYTLPWLVIADLRVDTYGKVRIRLARTDIPVSSRLRMDLSADTDKEYSAGLRYVLNPYLGITVHYDSEMKFGAGLSVNY